VNQDENEKVSFFSPRFRKQSKKKERQLLWFFFPRSKMNVGIVFWNF